MKSYRELRVWSLGMQVAREIYALTADFPKAELYGLTSQLRRAAVSVPTNLAEGHARDSSKEFLRFISIALGSIAELETLLLLAESFELGDKQQTKQIFDLLDEEGRMLRGLQKSLKSKL